MSRVEKNAAGEDVPVNTPEYGCIVIKPTPAVTPKNKPAAPAPDEEGAK